MSATDDLNVFFKDKSISVTDNPLLKVEELEQKMLAEASYLKGFRKFLSDMES